MLRNYLTSALRNLWKHKGYSLINVLGLSVAVASCLLLLFVVQLETAYDDFHPDVDRLYKVIRSTKMNKTEYEYTTGTLGPLGPALKATFPEVEHAIRFLPYWGMLEHEEKSLGGNISVTDPGVFEVFGFEVILGSREALFEEPFAIFVTERTAKQFFGNEDPLGKILTMDWLNGDYVVRGVIRDLPPTTTGFGALTGTLPDNYFARRHWEHWQPLTNSRPVETYVKLREGADPKALEVKLSRIVEANMGAKWVDKIGYRLTPIRDVWLYAHQEFGIDWYGDIAFLYAIAAIAGSILVIACFNYINLATARSQSRAQEVGLRKVVGAYRHQIAGQFFGEAAVVVGVATVLGIVIARLFLPTFNSLTDKNVPFDVLNQMAISGLLMVIGIVVLLSGIYPAIVLSSFQPTEVLKGSLHRTRSGIWLRRVLVIVQFGISVALGVGILVMDRQMAFIQTKDLGFTRKNILGVDHPLVNRQDLEPRLQEVREEFGRHPAILSSAFSRRFPGRRNDSNVIWIPEGPVRIEYRMPMMSIDEGFLDTYQIPLVAGRNLSNDIATDSTSAFILTESAARIFGWDNESAIGKELECPVREKQSNRPRGRIIGVVKDFHLNPLHRRMQPIVLFQWNWVLQHISLRYREGARDEVAAHVEKVWKRYDSSLEPEYFDLDEMLGWDYAKDNQLIKTSRVFGLIALAIACMGLMGLTAFTTQGRLKEVGVRKVLGGDAPGLVVLLTKEIGFLVILANVFAAPAGLWLADRWLASFEYRVEIDAMSFLLIALFSLLIAILTVSYQTLSAVRTNPVEVLRNE